MKKGTYHYWSSLFLFQGHVFGSSFPYTSFRNIVWSLFKSCIAHVVVIIHRITCMSMPLTKPYIHWFINAINCSLTSRGSWKGPSILFLYEFLLLIQFYCHNNIYYSQTSTIVCLQKGVIIWLTCASNLWSIIILWILKM